MPKKKSHFNRQEKAILRVIYQSRRFMTIRDIAEKSSMSWVTAKKYVNKLLKDGILIDKQEKNGSIEIKHKFPRYKFNYELIKKELDKIRK